MFARTHASARSMRRRFIPLATLAALALVLIPGCDETDATSIRIDIAPDGSGTLITSGIVTPSEGRPVEDATSGGTITWTGRAGIIVSKGKFTTLSDLTLAGITFEVAGGAASQSGAGRGPSILRVTLPRGKSAAWASLLAGSTDADRDQARAIITENPGTSTLASSVKITINAPGKVLGSGVSLRARGVAATRSETQAVLQIPSDIASQEADPIVWHVSWEPLAPTTTPAPKPAPASTDAKKP